MNQTCGAADGALRFLNVELRTQPDRRDLHFLGQRMGPNVEPKETARTRQRDP
jgi:hypothetical protein